jgi:uncharacterized membrane protein
VAAEEALTEEQRRKLEEFLEEEEGAASRHKRWLALFLTAVALTAIDTAITAWAVGLAVPATASSIICAVIAAPALMTLARQRQLPRSA